MDKVPVGLTRSKPVETKTEVDPVCKMLVTPETAPAKYDYEGKTYYFCNPGCKAKFAADPEKYLSTAETQRHGENEGRNATVMERATSHAPHASVQGQNSDIEYTCPMHPEIVQIGPGSCPICGMALEPKEITLDDQPDPEYAVMKRRFWISAVLTIPVFVLAMSEMFVNFDALLALPHGQASAIMIRKITEYPAEVLGQVGLPVTRFDKELTDLCADMFETMYDAEGVGLAAPQIGLNLRLFVMDCADIKLIAANPEIIHTEGEQSGQEGCLSVGKVPAVVIRPMKARLKAQDEKGEWFERDAEGYPARAFLHETDHCDGRLFIDHLPKLRREMIIKKFKKEKNWK